MQLILTRHAKERMSERDVSEGDVRAAILNPDLTRPATPSGTVYERKRSDGATICVAVVPRGNDSNRLVVKSVWKKEA